MTQVQLTQGQYKRLVTLIATRAGVLTVLERQNLLENCGLGKFVTRLHFDIPADQFSQELVRKLQDHGTLAETKQPALVSLLRCLHEIVAGQEDEAAFLDGLLAPYPTTSQKLPAASSPTRANPSIQIGGSVQGGNVNIGGQQTFNGPVTINQGTASATPAASQGIHILFLAANPRNTTALRLGEEIRTIEERLNEPKLRDSFHLHQHHALRWTDLSRYLLEHQPHIVHFSGHGTQGSELVMEDEQGKGQIIPPRVLSDLFRILKDNIRCVVLNACWSDKQAEAIAMHIDCVIGMARPVTDEAAVRFAAGFYRGIGYGRSVQTAFDLGRNELAAVIPSDKDVPRLLCRSGVDGSTLVLT